MFANIANSEVWFLKSKKIKFLFMATKTVSKKKAPPAKKTTSKTKKDIAAGYNQYKIFNGQQYTGMKIGRSHKWYYDKGEWHDKKLTPDLWEISYEVTKRRAGHAPKGSGVPVGTEYHWYILAHQMVKKLNADDYSTKMEGYKYKLAHKRADKDKWNISDKAQRKRLVKILQQMIVQLEKEPEELPVEEPVKKEKISTSKTKKTSPAKVRRRIATQRSVAGRKKASTKGQKKRLVK
jgi:hypothetical protein